MLLSGNTQEGEAEISRQIDAHAPCELIFRAKNTGQEGDWLVGVFGEFNNVDPYFRTGWINLSVEQSKSKYFRCLKYERGLYNGHQILRSTTTDTKIKIDDKFHLFGMRFDGSRVVYTIDREEQCISEGHSKIEKALAMADEKGAFIIDDVVFREL